MATEAQIAFFSYCREDSEFALKLAEHLKSAGAHVWIDQLDIEPGTPWDRAIEEALNNAPRMLVVLSPVSVNSDNVRDEVSFALSQRKRVIPVLYRDCDVPFRLARLQHIDFRPDYERGLKILLRALGVGESAHPEAAHPEATAVKEATVADAEEALKQQQAHAHEVERERAAAAEKAGLEEERKATAEKARLEEERKAADEKARVEEEKAAEKARLNQEESERTETETRARQEQLRREQRAAEQARLEEEARQAAENVRLAQEQQARQAAEIRARQEQLRREQQESVERARFDVAAMDQQQRETTAKQAVSDTETAAKSSGDIAAIQAPPVVHGAQPSARGVSSAKYIWGAVVLLLVIGLTLFWFTQRSKSERLRESKAAARDAGLAAETKHSDQPSPTEHNPDSAASPATTATSSPAESGGNHGTSSVTTAGTEGPGQEGTKTPSGAGKTTQIAAKSPANVSKMASETPGIPNRVQLPGDISKGFLIQEMVPVYPPLARQARIHGIVKLQVVIDKAGVVQGIKTVSGHPMLVPAAIDAVKKWRYRPFVVDNKPVEVDTTVTVNFQLTN